jgi:hypothetical protein
LLALHILKAEKLKFSPAMDTIRGKSIKLHEMIIDCSDDFQFFNGTLAAGNLIIVFN